MTIAEAGQLLSLEIKAAKLSPSTVEFYANRCAFFSKQLGDKPVNDITIHDLRAVMANSPPSSARHNFIALRRLFRFLYTESIIDEDPSRKLTSPKMPQTIVQPFSVEEMAAMLKAARSQQHWTSIRDTAILSTLFGTGIRRMELCALRDEDVDLHASTLLVTGKGRKQRIVPLPTKLQKVLLRYTFDRRDTRVYGKGSCQFFFRNRFGGPLSPNALTRIIRRLGRAIGIRAWPHRARHSFATYFMDHEHADLMILRELCGWSTLDMALRYVKPTVDKMRAAQDAFSPINRL